MQAQFNNNFGGSTSTSQFNDIDSQTDKDFIYNFNTLQSAFSHLIVGALINFNSTIQIAYIKKITIQETAPELVLAPTTLATTCGFSTNQNFTVSNPSGLENITSYEWNLGSASNGWLYSGSPAPQVITTSSNSLNLTTAYNATTVSNVGVTIKVNNVNFKSYTCNVTRSTLVPYLTGSGLTYSLSNFPPLGYTVSWSVSGNITINGSNTNSSVSLAGPCNSTATGTLTAIYTSPCGATVTTLSEAINIPPYSITGDDFLASCSSGIYEMNDLPQGATVAWEAFGDIEIIGSTTGNSISVNALNQSDWGQLTATIQLPCSSIPLVINKYIDTVVPIGTCQVLNQNSMVWDVLYARVDEVPGAAFYEWFTDGVLLMTTNGSYLTTENWQCEGHDLTVRAYTNCGYSAFANSYYDGICYNYTYSIYPNPTNDEVSIEQIFDETTKAKSTDSVKTQPYEIKIFNEKGEVVSSSKSEEAKKISINTQNLPNGMYYIHIIEGKKVISQPLKSIQHIYNQIFNFYFSCF